MDKGIVTIDADSILLTTRDVARHWQLDPATLENARYRGEGIPYIKLPTGGIRYCLRDILAAEAAGVRGFSFDRFAEVVGNIPGLDGNQKQAVIDAVTKAFKPTKMCGQ